MSQYRKGEKYPCWRVYAPGEKLPQMSFHNGRVIDLASPEVMAMLEKLAEDEMLMFYEHLFYGSRLPLNGSAQYLFGCNFTVTKNDDGSVCVFGNGCRFD